MKCKFCQSSKVVKYGTKAGNQYYLCRDCGRKFADNDALEGMRKPKIVVATALSLFYDGLSTEAISRQIKSIFAIDVEPTNVWRWVIKFSRMADRFLGQFKAHVSPIWVVDETVVGINGKNYWFWDVIDEKTRFLLATHISYARTITDAKELFEKCKERSARKPRIIISDKMRAYIQGISGVFEVSHLQSQGFTADINTNLIERFHGTLKQRTKVMRDLKTVDTARIVLNGFIVHYNFFRPHMELKDSTPAKVAGITLPFDSWQGFIEYRSKLS